MLLREVMPRKETASEINVTHMLSRTFLWDPDLMIYQPTGDLSTLSTEVGRVQVNLWATSPARAGSTHVVAQCRGLESLCPSWQEDCGCRKGLFYIDGQTERGCSTQTDKLSLFVCF